MSGHPYTLKWEPPADDDGVPSEVFHELRGLSAAAVCQEIEKLPEDMWVTITDANGGQAYNYFACEFDPRVL